MDANRKIRHKERKAAATPIDVEVGSRVRQRRMLLGMSQDKLGEALGLTFQQVQKYERGANRISASTLVKLSEVLDVPISFFFDGITEGINMPRGDDRMKRRDLEIIRALNGVSEEGRLLVHQLAKFIAEKEGVRETN